MLDGKTLVLILRLLLSPLLIACATLIGRRWGPTVSGWFTGFPFISAPISIIFALQNGFDYTVDAAIGTIGGQCCVCLFAIAYFFAAKYLRWQLCALIGTLVFVIAAFIWKTSSPGLWISVFVLLITVLGCLALTKKGIRTAEPGKPQWWDLPVRMIIAFVVVFGLTGIASLVGPKWSGIISAFPVFGLILASFTHIQQGKDAVGKLLRGSILGSFGIAAFYLILAGFLPIAQSLWIYLPASIGSVGANWISLQIVQAERSKRGSNE